jgi:hypothetical protein
MKLRVQLPQSISIHMCVFLSGGNARVAQHFLNGTQLRTTCKEMSGKTVSQGMRAHSTVNALAHDILFDNSPDGCPFQWHTTARNKHLANWGLIGHDAWPQSFQIRAKG